MPKKLIKRWLPDQQSIKANKHMRIFGDILHDANLWHLNRRSARKAFAVGIFMCFIPVPFQMLLAAGASILIHANLPLAVALVWLTNPVTMPAIFYGCYVVGTWVLGAPEQEFTFVASWQWVVDSLSTIGPAFFLGCGILAISGAIIAYLSIDAIWKISIARQWQKRMRRNT
jgi:uncharacterized protein (DUF2062 family)